MAFAATGGTVIADNDTILLSGGNVIQLNTAYIVPVGGIIAWAKSLDAGIPAIPGNFVECNGQVLSDADSPINGATIPDLNGDNSFMRGNSTSGGTGGSESHSHTITLSTRGVDNGSDLDICVTTPTGTEDTRPPFYDVVWIMRVK